LWTFCIVVGAILKIMQGSGTKPTDNNYHETAFTSEYPIFNLQTQCPRNNSGFLFPYKIAGTIAQQGMEHPYS